MWMLGANSRLYRNKHKERYSSQAGDMPFLVAVTTQWLHRSPLTTHWWWNDNRWGADVQRKRLVGGAVQHTVTWRLSQCGVVRILPSFPFASSFSLLSSFSPSFPCFLLCFFPVLFKITFYFGRILDLQKSCKGSAESSHKCFTQIQVFFWTVTMCREWFWMQRI